MKSRCERRRSPRRRGAPLSLAVLVTLGAGVPADEASARSSTLVAAVSAVAASVGIAPELLTAVVWAESRGHPWALNIDGVGLYPRTQAEAVALLRAVRGRADIGLAQIHYPLWGPVFELRPEDLLDPWINLHVAARILRTRGGGRGQDPQTTAASTSTLRSAAPLAAAGIGPESARRRRARS
jgi:hypothetical protein